MGNLERVKRWRENHPEHKEKDLEYQRNWAKHEPEKRLFKSCRDRARNNGIEFNLILSDIVIPTHCPVLGLELSRTRSKRTDRTPSVDRLDNSKGYTKDNIKIISWRANKLKADAKLIEVQAVYNYMKEHSCA